jgi:GDPmannose 4,6-dehydratase
MKTALITGINGQDGSYLSEHLLDLGYKVFGLIKRNSIPETQTARLESVYNKINVEYGDMTDMASLAMLIKHSKPDEIYHLAAQSHVHVSFIEPIYTCNVNAIGTLNLLESVRLVNKNIKVYNAASSEMFGNSMDKDGYQRESTLMAPVSPYACSKVFAYNLCRNYRNSYGIFISNGILFNHESPRRASNFVTAKVVKGAIDIYRNKQLELLLGNIDSQRDWGHARDYVRAMHLMLQQDAPDDFVISTGETHSVRELCEYVFRKLGLDYNKYVKISKDYIRPEDLRYLKGDCSYAKEKLGWSPKYTFKTLLDDMINYWKEKL